MNVNPIDFMQASNLLRQQKQGELTAVQLDAKRKAEIIMQSAADNIYDAENTLITAKLAFLARRIDIDAMVINRNRNATLIDYEYAQQHDDTLVDLLAQKERCEALLTYNKNKFEAAKYLILA